MLLDVTTEQYVRWYLNDTAINPLTDGYMPGYNQQVFRTVLTDTENSITLPSLPAANTIVQVFKNGSLLDNVTSYTVDTSGLIFTFTNQLVAGDVVVIYFWETTP